MRVFISAGEPSGDLHAANLVRGLRRHRPDLEAVGFGGERLEAVGGRLLYPLCRLALMGVRRVVTHIPFFFKLLRRAERSWEEHRPDAVVLIDYPGFNWWVARRARARGLPVFWFVPPQLWAWGGWRVRKMRRYVDHVLCSLPFEEDWYRQRSVPAHYVGHPYFDELARQPLDAAFVAAQRARPGRVIGLLPGSRTQEVEGNLPTLLRTAREVHAACPDTRFPIACFKEAHYERAATAVREQGLSYVEACLRRTPEIIHLAHSCVAVSGSVGLELMYHGKPSVVVYRVGAASLFIGRWLLRSRWISLVNLLAQREIFPEFLTSHCPAEAAAAHLRRWLDDPAAYAAARSELADLRRRMASPGACDRAAQYVLDALAGRRAAAA